MAGGLSDWLAVFLMRWRAFLFCGWGQVRTGSMVHVLNVRALSSSISLSLLLIDSLLLQFTIVMVLMLLEKYACSETATYVDGLPLNTN